MEKISFGMAFFRTNVLQMWDGFSYGGDITQRYREVVMYTIATIKQLQAHLGITQLTPTETDRLLLALGAAAQHFTQETHRHFEPFVATLPHHPDPRYRHELLVREDLLELWSVTDELGEIAVNDVERYPSPALPLVLRLPVDRAWFGTVQVRGLWGWHDHFNPLWQPIGTLGNGGLNAQNTTFTVLANALPTLVIHADEVGALLRVGNELMRVVVVSQNTYTVLRGVNHTTPETHPALANVQCFQPSHEVVMSVLQLAEWFYRAADRQHPAPFTQSVFDLCTRLRRVRV